MKLTIGSCCSGIGGIDLGLEAAGLGPVRWQIEIDPFCRHVLRKHWPNARLIDDLTTVDVAGLERVDLVAAGTPCQNLSSAGDRSGLDGPKSRLFYAFLRVVREMRPPWIVFENVASGASRWVDAVRCLLEELGYATLPIQVAARDLGAPHIRSRVFIVANRGSEFRQLEQGRREGRPHSALAGGNGALRIDADSDDQPDAIQSTAREGLPGAASDTEGERGGTGRSGASQESPRLAEPAGGHATNALLAGREGTGPAAHSGRAGSATDSWWASEPNVVPVVHGLSGGLAGRYRRAALRAIGNSCSPAQAQVIGEVIRFLVEAEEAA